MYNVVSRSSLFISSALAKAKQTAKGMAQIEEITDADISEVQESANKFNIIDSATKALRTFFSFIHAISWIDTRNRDTNRAVQSILDETYGDPVQLITGEEEIPDNAPEAVHQVLEQAKELYEEERFLHWEITFPGI